MNLPLAERQRPQTIDQVVGQAHVLAEGKLLRRLVEQKQPFSLIFWGPPGSGKTTLARIIAKEMQADFVEMSAVTAGKADILKTVERAKANLQTGTPTVLFVDEIHRFNKAQQDAFLPHVENGLVTLIGATTENPSFEVITPLLSRSRVIVLEPLAKADVETIIRRAATSEKVSTKQLPARSIAAIAELSGGDARVALGILELTLRLAGRQEVSVELVQTTAQKRVPDYDKTGEMHYSLMSAFIKSLRGSNATAALYYLARILQGGEDPKFVARRMVVFASEDIGLAGNGGLNLAVSAFLAVERIGMPECQYALFHCAAALAKAEKSRRVADAMYAAGRAARDSADASVPLHLRNAPTKLMKDLGYQKNYEWQANFQHEKGFLPEEVKDLKLL